MQKRKKVQSGAESLVPMLRWFSGLWGVGLKLWRIAKNPNEISGTALGTCFRLKLSAETKIDPHTQLIPASFRDNVLLGLKNGNLHVR